MILRCWRAVRQTCSSYSCRPVCTRGLRLAIQTVIATSPRRSIEFSSIFLILGVLESARLSGTHDFAVFASKIEPQKTGAVVRGHFQFIEGSSPEWRGRRSGAHAIPGGAPRSGGVKREAFLVVDNQLTGLALPRATWRAYTRNNTKLK